MARLSSCVCAGLIGLALLPPRPAAAAWPTDPLVSVPLCTAAGHQYYPMIVTDGAGGAIVSWQDLRSGNWDIYAQRVLATGTSDPGWPADGRALCTAAGDQAEPMIVADGAGGAIVTWEDNRGGNWDIYAQRVRASGTVDPAWPADGLALCSAAGDQEDPAIVSDGAGGAIVTWQDYRTGTYSDIYAQRVRASGTVDPAWPANGRALCTALLNQWYPEIATDGAGGAIVTWRDKRSIAYWDIYAQRVRASGTVDPAWPADGRALCTAADDQTNSRIVADGAGGAIVAWRDGRSDSYDVYAEHVLASGAVDPAWPANGRALCTVGNNQEALAIVADGAGGAIVAWHDYRSGATPDIYAHHVLASGTVDPAWPADGRALCTAAGDQSYPRIASDGTGGAIVTWHDHRSDTNYDIYAQHALASGAVDPAWPTDGRVLCSAPSDQGSPAIVADGASGAIVTWHDYRGGATSDIYAQRVDRYGLLGGIVPNSVPGEATLAFALDPVRPNPARGSTLRVHFTLASAAAASLEFLDVAGRRIAAREVGSLGPGHHWLDLGAGRRLTPGLYLVRLRQGASVRVTRVVVLD